MSKFIEFYTSPRRQYAKFSLGNPIHDGKLPNRLADSAVVRVNREPVQFVDESTPELLLKALHEMQQLRVKVGINCRRFAALMYEPSIATKLPGYFTQPDYATQVTTDDMTVTKPVVLGILSDTSSPNNGKFYGRHMAIPAHQPQQVTYLHKLGYEGPICLSGLQAAMNMYDCTHAYLPQGFANGQLG